MPAWDEILSEIQGSAAGHGGNPDCDGIRRRYLAELQRHTGRSVILYATRFTAQDVQSNLTSISDEDMTGIMTVVHRLPGPNLDLILHSPGGSPEAAEAIVEYLRSKFKHIRVVVPQLALSAATMVACSADEIALGKHSFLGPIDPQVFLPTPLGNRYVPAQAITEQFEKAVRECQQGRKLPAWLPMLNQYGPDLLVACDNATKLSKELVSRWLAKWMFKDDKRKDFKADRIAKWLSSHGDFLSHARHIPRAKLILRGLHVVKLESDQVFQDLVLSVFHATIHTFNNTGAVKLIENHAGRAFVKVTAQQQFSTLPGRIPGIPQGPIPVIPQ